MGNSSPGHQRWPDHKVQEQPLDQRFQVAVNGEVIAESTDVVKVEEDKHPPRYYFPRADVRMDALEPSATTSECPFKGHASYFHLTVGGKRLEDAAWSYEDPYEEHTGLKGRIAFYDDKLQEIEVKSANI